MAEGIEGMGLTSEQTKALRLEGYVEELKQGEAGWGEEEAVGILLLVVALLGFSCVCGLIDRYTASPHVPFPLTVTALLYPIRQSGGARCMEEL